MLKCLTKSLFSVVCLWLAVGPLAILQLGAWTWMVASYTQDSSFNRALKETFSDAKPCQMCRLIDSVEAETESETAPLPGNRDKSLKLMLGLGRAIRVAEPHMEKMDTFFEFWRYPSSEDSVPTPPPRSRA